MSNLTKILSRLACRLPCDTWKLTENELDILDAASGEEIATIVYRNSLNIVRIVENGDKMITEHNEHNEKKYLRELRHLTMLLVGEPPKKKEKENIQQDMEAIERRLLEETIEEVMENRQPLEEADAADKELNTNSYSWINLNIQERLKKGNFVENRLEAAPNTFVSQMQSTGLSPSLNRHQSQIDLPINKETDINDISPSEELPEATNEVLADLGMYTTPFGRQLFNKLNNTEQVQQAAELQPVDELSRLIQRASLEVPQVLPEFSVGINEGHSFPEVDAARPSLAVPVEAIPIRPSQSIAVPPDVTVDDPLTAHEQVLMKLAEEAAERQKNAPKKRRNRRKKAAAPQPVATDIDERNKPLRNTKHKALVPSELTMYSYGGFHFETDFVNEPYQDDPPEDEEVPAAGQIIDESQEPLADILGFDQPMPVGRSTGIHQIPTPMASPTRQAPYMVQPPVGRPSVIHQTQTPMTSVLREAPDTNHPPKVVVTSPRRTTLTKRPRLDSYQELEVQPVEFVPVVERRISETPFAPRLTSTVLRKTHEQRRTTSAISTNDMEFANWQHKSAAVEPQTLPPGEGKENRRPTRSGNDDEYDEQGNHLFRRVKGKYDTMIDFVGADGKVKTCSNYSMETFGLYMQIRFIMAENNTFKMSFEELYPKISLINTQAKRIIVEMRLMLLQDFKFLKLTLTDDEEHIVDVEIPIQEMMEVEN